MTLEVIGAGVGRTGTYSLKLALEQLGYGPCYHMEEVFKDPPRRIALWSDALAGKPDWPATFEGYHAAVDWPVAAFWQELATAYPDAKVVLTTRSTESWCASYSQTIFKLMAGRDEAPPHLRPWFDMAIGVTQKSGLYGTMSPAGLGAAFDAEVAAVKAALPPERLLVFEVKDGWQPLCTFLDQPVPATPFPRTNNSAEFWELVERAFG
jgi:Sulfotransferase domain